MENYLSLSPRCYIFFLKLIWLFFFFDFSTESIQSTSSTTSSISCSDNRCFEFVLNPDGVLLLQTFAHIKFPCLLPLPPPGDCYEMCSISSQKMRI